MRLREYPKAMMLSIWKENNGRHTRDDFMLDYMSASVEWIQIEDRGLSSDN